MSKTKSKEPKATKLSLEPQSISSESWYYEGLRGLTYVCHIYVNGQHIRTDQTLIPWSKIVPSTRRYLATRTPEQRRKLLKAAPKKKGAKKNG